ncbi:hypothetical protein P7C70_g9599, partial [Phenoliferia sp. Uapishka_3]
MAPPTDAQLHDALSHYSSSLSTRASASKSSADLVDLDLWFRTTLREQVKDPSTPLTIPDLGKLMEWKLAVRSFYPSSSVLHSFSLPHTQRGKWRPRLVTLALSNSRSLLSSVLETLPIPSTPPLSSTAALTFLKSLSQLSGIGPATASAILSVYYPTAEPFMSDEAWEVAVGGKAEYTV